MLQSYPKWPIINLYFMKNFCKILFFILFFVPISKVFSHEKIANSQCNLFIKNVIENYETIKDHYWLSFVDSSYGFLIEKTWDPNLSYKDERGETLGDTKFRRDEDGNIFIGNVFSTYALKTKLRPGDKIVKINDKKTINYTDEKIDELFDNKEKKISITYINQLNQKSTIQLETFEEPIIYKNLNFEIKNFNFLNNQTFETEFLVNYYIQAELYDGITKDDYTDMDNDNLFRLTKQSFYNKDDDGNEWYGECAYTNDELNQMQLISPGWTVGLSNLSFKSEDTSTTTTSLRIYDELTGADYESVDIISEFNGQIKTKNDFDLRNFPFDKQRIVFSFSEMQDTEVTVTPLGDVYMNLHKLLNKENFINGWDLVDYRVQGNNYQEQGFYKDRFLNSTEIILEIERQSSYYVYKIILPIILILMVCWSVIWISPKELESRLTVTIVCLLSLIAYNFVIDKEIPKLEYLTIMDWIIFASYVFATIPNFLCIISFKLYSSNKKLCMAIENKSKYFGPISYVVIILLIITYNVNAEPDASVQALRLLAR